MKTKGLLYAGHFIFILLVTHHKEPVAGPGETSNFFREIIILSYHFTSQHLMSKALLMRYLIMHMGRSSTQDRLVES